MVQEENGNIYVTVQSIDRDELVVSQKGVVRAFMVMGGWKFEKLEGNKTRATYQVELDLKGSIPGFVMKQANKDQGYQIVKLRKTVAKYIANGGVFK